jgi:hypothetical protein
MVRSVAGPPPILYETPSPMFCSPSQSLFNGMRCGCMSVHVTTSKIDLFTNPVALTLSGGGGSWAIHLALVA